MRNPGRQIEIVNSIKGEVEAENAAWRRRQREQERERRVLAETPCGICGEKGARALYQRADRLVCPECDEVCDLAGLLDWAFATAPHEEGKDPTWLQIARLLHDAGVRQREVDEL
jgi:hypothetical protein